MAQTSNTTSNTTSKSTSNANLGVNAIVFTALTIITLLVVNVGAHYVYGRADLTEDGLYTLSPVSKDLVKNAKGELKIRLFVSKKLVAGLLEVRQYVIDKLKDYEDAARGNFSWEVIHPEDSDEAKELTEQYRIPKFDAQTKRAGSKESREIHFGLVISYKAPGKDENYEVIPILGWDIQKNLEYLITERIHRLVKGRKKVALITGHNEVPGKQLQQLLKALNKFFKNYEVVEHDIRQKGKLPDDAVVAIVIPPKTPWNGADRKKLDEFVMRGKRGVLFLVEGMARQKQRRQLQMQRMPNIMMPAQHGLNELLWKWGVKIQGNYVLDEGQKPLLVPGRGGRAQIIFHPALLNMYVSRRLRAPVTPLLASSLEIKRAYVGKEIKPGSKFKIQPLLMTSDKAWTVKGPYVPNLRRRDRPPEDAKRGQYIVGALVEGTLPSAYPKKGRKESAGQSRLVVIGDFDILARLGGIAGNKVFLQNVVDLLAQDEALVSLRNKQMQDRALTLPEKKGNRTLVDAAIIIGMPLLLILFGVGRWQLRLYRRRRANEWLS